MLHEANILSQISITAKRMCGSEMGRYRGRGFNNDVFKYYYVHTYIYYQRGLLSWFSKHTPDG